MQGPAHMYILTEAQIRAIQEDFPSWTPVRSRDGELRVYMFENKCFTDFIKRYGILPEQQCEPPSSTEGTWRETPREEVKNKTQAC